MILRQFRPDGIEAFRAFLEACRAHPRTPYPKDLLEDNKLTSVVSPETALVFTRLETKTEAAEYLKSLLQPFSEHEVAVNAGLWTWLTLHFFDDVCPPRGGARSVKNDYYYIFEPKNPRHFYRHLLFISWRVLCLSPTHNRLFLRGSVSSLDTITREVLKRLYLTRIPCIFEVLDRLYWDESRRRPQAGIVTQNTVKAGDLLHRLPIRIRQLERTYDLLSLNADQLLELLGDEFQQMRHPRATKLGTDGKK